MNKHYKFFNLIIIFLTLYLSSCETLNVKPIDTHGVFIKDADEERMWKRCAEEQDIIARSGWVYNDANLTVYLNDLTKKIITDNVKETSVSVKVIIVKNSLINAMMYPNGIMYVHTGLLANIENEAQLVSILGHEVTHFINRHTLKQFRNTKNKSAFFATISMILTSASGLTTSPTDYSSLAMYNLISSVNGYSKEQEREADNGGFSALLRNNYSLSESVKVMEIFERNDKDDKNKQRVPYAFLDHPTNKERIKYLKRLCKLHETESNEKNRLLGEDIYRKNTNSLLLDNAGLDIKASRFNSAKRTIEKYLQLAPQDARAYYYLGEVFSNRNEKDDKEKAIENYKKSIDLNKDFPPPHRDLGLIYYKNKLSDEAKREFKQYLALVPNAEDKKYITIYLDELGKGDKQ
jgi:predicted Zn-dependent protease